MLKQDVYPWKYNPPVQKPIKRYTTCKTRRSECSNIDFDLRNKCEKKDFSEKNALHCLNFPDSKLVCLKKLKMWTFSIYDEKSFHIKFTTFQSVILGPLAQHPSLQPPFPPSSPRNSWLRAWWIHFLYNLFN